jgi:predicted transcriptional regulator of viral defense system
MEKNTPTKMKTQILNFIADNEILVFSLEELLALSGYDYSRLKYALETMIKAEQIFRLENGHYCVRNCNNVHLIANFLLKDSQIAYWSALNLHGLTEQIPNVVYSQSTHKKNDKTIFNVLYKFVRMKPEKTFGIMQMGYGNEMFRITNIEKTLLDCFDLPQYSGGYAELIRAFYSAKVKSARLLEYGLKMNNLAIIKRMAFLSELFEMKGFTRFQQEVLRRINQNYTLIDPLGENKGKFVSKWSIRLNISKENLLGIIQKIY